MNLTNIVNVGNYLHTAFKMYMHNCKWQKQNMTETEPKQVKVYKAQHCDSKVSIVHIFMDKNMLMKVQ